MHIPCRTMEMGSYKFIIFGSTVRRIRATLCALQLIPSPVRSKADNLRRDKRIYEELVSFGLVPIFESWSIVYRINPPTNQSNVWDSTSLLQWNTISMMELFSIAPCERGRTWEGHELQKACD